MSLCEQSETWHCSGPADETGNAGQPSYASAADVIRQRLAALPLYHEVYHRALLGEDRIAAELADIRQAIAGLVDPATRRELTEQVDLLAVPTPAVDEWSPSDREWVAAALARAAADRQRHDRNA